jgi:hypothetical protein
MTELPQQSDYWCIVLTPAEKAHLKRVIERDLVANEGLAGSEHAAESIALDKAILTLLKSADERRR